MFPLRILLAGAVLASGVRADWLLSDYAVSAADSASVNASYGIQSYQNLSSKVTTKVSEGAVALVASVVASDGTEGYSANVGLLHPITPDWSAHDLTGLISIDFEFRNSAAITEYFAVSFGSPAYSDAVSSAGTVFEARIDGASDLKSGTAWKKVSVLATNFATPKWWTDIPSDFPSLQLVLKKVKNLQFAPKTLYSVAGTQKGVACSKCVTPTMTSQTLEIRNIVLVGVESDPLPNPGRIGCSGAVTVLDKSFDDAKHELGGYWFSYSDFDSTGTSKDSAKGSSSVAYKLTPGDEFASGNIALDASLNKRVGGAWHKYAGWAAIGAGFDNGLAFKAGTFKAFGFRLAAASLPSSVHGVRFKAGLRGVPDTATHSAFIPASALLTAGGVDVCIRSEDLAMPSHIAEAARVAFDVDQGVLQLAWEVRIADDRNPLLDTATVGFSISDVRAYGERLVTGVGPARTRFGAHQIAIAYGAGVLTLRGLNGITTVDILSLDGRRVASFAPASRLPLQLARGTWILAAHRGDGTVATQSFAVLDR